MSPTNELTPKLKIAKEEVDNYYKSNPMLKLPFATAAWSFLAFGEEAILKQINNQLTSQEIEIAGDKFINQLQYPVFWLYNGCNQEGQIPFAYNDKIFKASWNLFKLGQQYEWFDAVYRYAYDGWVELELQETTIQSTNNLFTNMEYQAYNSLIKAHETDEALSLINTDDFMYLSDKIRDSIKVVGNRFSYDLNPRMVADIIEFITPGYNHAFLLPGEWEFSRYILADFRRVFTAILALAFIRWRARYIAVEQVGLGFGYSDSIYVPTCDELLNRVVRYSGVPKEKVQSVFDDLTYGNRGIKHSDVALQPLIKLNSKHYAIMPSLWISLAPERNLTVLLNKVPKDQRIYSKLSNEQEDLMKQHIKDQLSNNDLRLISGKVPKTGNVDLGDIDLAIISDSEKACLLIELKWFIAPAEIHEIINKSKHIKKGVSQMLNFRQAFANNYAPLITKLGIDSSYRFETVVASQNWIGYVNVQSPEVPVIRADHLVAKLKMTDSLQSSIVWLKDRKYLPTEGVDFEKHGITSTIGNWTVKWKTTRPLIKDVFFPL